MLFDHFQFGSVFIKKKSPNWILFFFKPKPVQTDLFRFSSVFLDKNQFKPVWLGFFGLGPVRFDFFGFGFIKPKPNQSVFLKF